MKINNDSRARGMKLFRLYPKYNNELVIYFLTKTNQIMIT